MINRGRTCAGAGISHQVVKTGPEAQKAWSLGRPGTISCAVKPFLPSPGVMWGHWRRMSSALRSRARLHSAPPRHAGGVRPGPEEVSSLEAPNVVGNTTGGTWHGVISKLSKHPEVVYDLFAFHATKKVALWNGINGWTGVDPDVAVRCCHHTARPPWRTIPRKAGTSMTCKSTSRPMGRTTRIPRCPSCAFPGRSNTGSRSTRTCLRP